ncbi:MAG: cold shock domain-containing protein [Deltaproteobacteria bacterium]|nr:cold shock domain-containing protein [Deltaproteobacteria bacterium]
MPARFMTNTVPIPFAVVQPMGVAEAKVAEDLFSKGEIVKFFPQQSYGFVRDAKGRELFFHVDEIDLLGVKNRREQISVGAKVGYDCSRTTHGLRVKRMKIY